VNEIEKKRFIVNKFYLIFFISSFRPFSSFRSSWVEAKKRKLIKKKEMTQKILLEEEEDHSLVEAKKKD
jgi:hypothetical protein